MKTERISTTGRPGVEESQKTGGVESEIQTLLKAGKCKQAVELAKDLHKKANTPESEELLVGAYVARIEQFENKGMPQEASALLALVQERFPGSRHRLLAVEIRVAAAAGRIDDLLRPLGSDETPAEIRNLIEFAVAKHVTDLPAVAASDALPAGHPLRTAADAVWAALSSVTNGPVSDAQIALPEVSHRSPLAAWKLLIRAIAAFYRQDDAGCRRAIDAIAADSAIAHVSLTLRDMLDRRRPKAGIAAALYDRVLANDQGFTAALQRIESSLQIYDLPRLLGDIRNAMRICAQARPELSKTLNTHIAMSCLMHDVPSEALRSVLGAGDGDAYFWRMFARTVEMSGSEAVAATAWEQFVRQAVFEKQFDASSPEAAAVWLHIADVLSPLSLCELEAERADGEATAILKEMREEGVIRPSPGRGITLQILEPGEPYRRAAMIRPDQQTYQRWWDWAQSVDLPDKQKEDIAVQWSQSRPRDVHPLVLLSSLAESRKALTMAMRRLTEAEAIDPLNKQVRQARVRLLMSIAWRHFADGKPHLVAKDLSELSVQPSMREGDRAAVLEAMRAAWHSLRGDPSSEEASLQKVTEVVGSIISPHLYLTIKLNAGLTSARDLVPEPAVGQHSPLDIALALARFGRLTEELRLTMYRPVIWSSVVSSFLKQRPCPLSNTDLFAIGRNGVAAGDHPMSFEASAAGLARTESPAVTARFLLMRARSLDKGWITDRGAQCLRAGLALARQAHDEDLIRELLSAIDRAPAVRYITRSGAGMSEEAVRELIEEERSGRHR